MLESGMDQRVRLLNYLFEHYYTPKMRAAATGAPGRALPGGRLGCSGWWRAGHPSLPCHCPSSPLPAPGAVSLGGSTVQQPRLFAGTGILQGLLRGSSALGTGDAANTGMVLSPARHHAAVGFICFTAPDHSCPSYFSVFMTTIGPTLPLLLGKKKCNKHTLQFAQKFSTAQAKTSLYVLGIYLK